MSKQTFYTELDKYLGNEFDVRETLKLVKYDISVFWSWGAHNLVNLTNKGLLFKVNGYLHKGFVLVTYDAGPDLYCITLLSGQYNLKEKDTGIYCDELQERIDNLVEKQSDYKPIVKPTFG